ncbi:MAG TPA: phosphoglycerate dehydrogenase [Gammaproteobacteria bacterium]|nr:phosphoglycerate dehydrogenase [Gammaproteobacteria bacterium]
MFKIQLLNSIATTGLRLFPNELYEVGTEVANPDAILVRSSDMINMAIPSSVKVVGRAGAGVNNIPVARLTEQGIPVLNTPGANANAVRELVIGSMLLASRNIYQALDYVKHLTSNGLELDKQVEQNKKQFVGFELMGKTLGLIGLGSVGVKVANAAIALGMKVIGYDPNITVNRAWELSADVQQAPSMEGLLASSDFISVHVPLMKETHHLINQTSMQIMKPGVILLNFSREGIVDNQAILDALNEKKVALYINDFPNAFFKDQSKIISLPHLGASTLEAEENCAVMVVKQVREFLERGNIINSVNFPYVEFPSNKNEKRLAIVNKNIPNMVAQISAKLAAAGFNIGSLLNKSKDDIAYTMIDIDALVPQNILQEIAKIEGVIQVRQL